MSVSASGKKKTVAKRSFEKGTISAPKMSDRGLVFVSHLNSRDVFSFLADNSNVEWSLVTYKNNLPAEIGNSYKESSNFILHGSVLKSPGNVIEAIHSHPNNSYPSDKDKKLARRYKSKKILWQIYHKPSKEYIEYDEKGSIYKETYFDSGVGSAVFAD